MRWEDEQWVKLYTRDTATWKRLSWEGKALLVLLLRKVDRAGALVTSGDVADDVAAMLDMPTEVVAAGLESLAERGVAVVAGDTVMLPNFLAAQTTRQSDKARKIAQRERDRAEMLAAGNKGSKAGLDIQASMARGSFIQAQQVSPAVTPSVTGCHTESPTVTSGHEEKRREEKRVEENKETTLSSKLDPVPVEQPAFELLDDATEPLRKANPPDVAVFEHWKAVMGHPKAAYDDKRKRLIRTALKSYSPEDAKQAIDGCALTPHNMGKNDRGERFDGLHIVFGSAENTDRFIRNAREPPKPSNGIASGRVSSDTWEGKHAPVGVVENAFG